MKLTEIFQNHNGEDLVVKNKEGVTVAVVGQPVTDGIYQLLDLLESEGYSIEIVGMKYPTNTLDDCTTKGLIK